VMFGGGQNALADDAYPYFPDLMKLIRTFTDRQQAVLGICLGSQLIARAFGGENHIGTAREFGWQKVSLAPEAKADAVLGGLPASFPTFQWHDDTFSLPDGAVRLAGNAVAENQAFRVGRATYGFQFHFEADQALVRHRSVPTGLRRWKRTPPASARTPTNGASPSRVPGWRRSEPRTACVAYPPRRQESVVDDVFRAWPVAGR